jgi:hypothetical protein
VWDNGGIHPGLLVGAGGRYSRAGGSTSYGSSSIIVFLLPRRRLRQRRKKPIAAINATTVATPTTLPTAIPTTFEGLGDADEADGVEDAVDDVLEFCPPSEIPIDLVRKSFG